MDEFEEMRQQMASMKMQLDTQQIVNRDLMRKVMRGKASWMNGFVKAELIAMPFLYLLIAMLCHGFGISQWYAVFFLLFGGIDAILDTRTVSIPNKLFGSASILDLRKFLVRQKKERFIQTCVSGSICIVWFIMFINATFTSETLSFIDKGVWEAVKTGNLAGCFVGVIVAIVVVVVLYRKMQRTNDQILDDIDKFENEV